MNTSDTSIRLEEIELLVRHYYTQHTFAKEMFSHIDVKAMFAHSAETMVLQLRACVMGERIQEFEWPADWREAFKERWFPEWALRRWPVKLHRVKVDIHHPHLNYKTGARLVVYDSEQSKGYPHFEDMEPEA